MPYKNKEDKNANSRKWAANNKEKIKIKEQKWRKNNPEVYRKGATISNWKRRGMISKNWEATYNHYLNCHYCEWCDEKFKPEYWDKCLDHDHDINNEVNIRGVLCQYCNTQDYLGKFMQTL